MGDLTLKKENAAVLLNMFKERYGDKKISDLIVAMLNDTTLKEVALAQKAIFGKRAKLVGKDDKGTDSPSEWEKLD